MPVFGKSSSASKPPANPVPPVATQSTPAASGAPPSGAGAPSAAGPIKPQAQTQSLLGAVLAAYMQLFKDAFWMLKVVIFNPTLFVPMLIFWIILGVATAAAWFMVLSYGPMVVAATALFLYVRSLDRFSLRLVNKNMAAPPMPAEPRLVAAIYRAVGRGDAATEGPFRTYFFRLAWWDFHTIFMDAFRSVIALGDPVVRRTASSAGGGNMLTRAITLPLLAMVGVLSLLCLFVFVGLSIGHLLAVVMLTLMARMRGDRGSGDRSSVAAPRRLAGVAAITTWVAVPFVIGVMTNAENSRPIRSVPQAATSAAASDAVSVVPQLSASPQPAATEPAAPSPLTAPAPSNEAAVESDPPPIEAPSSASPPAPASSHATAPITTPMPPTVSSSTRPTAVSPSGERRPPPARPIVLAPPAPIAVLTVTPAPVSPALPPRAESVAPLPLPPAPEPPKVDPASPAAPVFTAPAAYSGPASGRLEYDGTPVPQNGEVVFRNLPPGVLDLRYDRQAWSHRLAPESGGTQRLVLRSLKPGTQRRVIVTWSMVR